LAGFKAVKCPSCQGEKKMRGGTKNKKNALPGRLKAQGITGNRNEKKKVDRKKKKKKDPNTKRNHHKATY